MNKIINWKEAIPDNAMELIETQRKLIKQYRINHESQEGLINEQRKHLETCHEVIAKLEEGASLREKYIKLLKKEIKILKGEIND